MQKQQIDAQKINLQQQAAYIKNLESLQHEVRRFRHDFKNMMSGMYLQAQDGNISAVQTFIQNITADFDHQVEGELKLMNQLANIHHLAVKSLVLTKLEQMKQSNIHYHLEVFRTFDKTQLRETDLCRCLGILIDNAIEAVQGHPEGQIHMIISSQGDYTTFLVKNTLHEAIDFHKIGTVGYSTKNKDRGVGLASYHRILSQYGFALPSTTVKNGFFIQELKIIEK
ncbi:sensor histidine kinase [Frisingicoccus sp.]|uniref:sensor histidine kinase n=1 Tax=Frisingicoccus sp. TaxID=1918627 RepID=UPI003AB26B85